MTDPSYKSLKLFSYQPTKDAYLDKGVNIRYGDKWSNLKGENKNMNSIFDIVDKKYGNGDGIVQASEVNLLNKLVKYIDNLKGGTKGNGCLEVKELESFNKMLKKGQFDISQLEEKDSASNKPWSEGLDRNITTIKLANNLRNAEYLPEVKKKMIEIGKIEGFTVEETYSDGNPWIEDSSIRRSDGKIYNQLYPGGILGDTNKYAKALNTPIGQGGVQKGGYNFDVDEEITNTEYGASYLEGGNVLNTCKADGQPGAIIGDGSIANTLRVMDLEPTEENIAIAKKQIAQDLGLKEDNVTFIPQYDFHIDMLYRPLHNGEMAIPDFEEGIRLLKETDISNMKPEEKENRIKNLELLADKTRLDRMEAEKRLSEAGYKIVKLPNFTIGRRDETNFMNGVGGTSPKTGKTFYITNESKYPDLQKIITKYLNAVGIDNVYFVPTREALLREGGIDCLTQEF